MHCPQPLQGTGNSPSARPAKYVEIAARANATFGVFSFTGLEVVRVPEGHSRPYQHGGLKSAVRYLGLMEREGRHVHEGTALSQTIRTVYVELMSF